MWLGILSVGGIFSLGSALSRMEPETSPLLEPIGDGDLVVILGNRCSSIEFRDAFTYTSIGAFVVSLLSTSASYFRVMPARKFSFVCF